MSTEKLVALRDTPHGRRPLVVLLAVFAVVALDGALFTVAAPDIARALDLDVTELLDIVAFVSILVVVAGIGLAWVMDRWRRLPFVWAGYALSGVFTILVGRAGSYGALGTALALDGAMKRTAQTPLLSLLADWYPIQARGRVFSAIQATATAAGVVGLVGAGLLVDGLGYRLAFAFVGLLLLLIGLAAGVLLREPAPGGVEGRAVRRQPPTIVESFRLVYAVPTTRRLVVSLAIASVGSVISAFALPFLLADAYGLDAVGRGLALLPQALGAILGARFIGSWIDRAHTRSPDRVVLAFAAAFLLTALGVLLFVARPPLAVLIVGTFPLGVVAALAGPALNTVLTALIPPAGRTVGLQLVSLPVIPALVLGPAFAGVLESSFGLAGLFLGAVPFFVLAAAIQVAAAPGYAQDLRRIAAAGMVREAFDQPDPPILVARVGDRTLRVLAGELVSLPATDEVVAVLESDVAPPGTVVQVDGRDVFAVPPGERLAAGLAVVGPDAGVPFDVTVGASLRLLARSEDDLRHALTIAPELVDLARQPGSELERRQHWMAALVRAVATGASVVVVDADSTCDIDVQVVAARVRDLGRTVIVVDRPRQPATAPTAPAPIAPAPTAPGPGARLVAVSDPLVRLHDQGHPGAVVVDEPAGTDLCLDDLLSIVPTVADDLAAAIDAMRLPRDIPVGDLDRPRRRLVGLVAAVAAGHQTVVTLDPTAGTDGSDASALVGDLWRLKQATDARLVLVAAGATPAGHLADERVVAP